MADTQIVFDCPRHGLLRKHQVRGRRCKQCASPVQEVAMREELVSFDRELSALQKRPRPRKVVHHAHC